MRWGLLKSVLIVVAAWTLVALSWTPPSILIQTAFGPPRIALTDLDVFANVLCNFVPWMAATPLILWLGRRFPVTEGRVVLPLAVHVLAGAVIVPAATFLGIKLGRLVFTLYVTGQTLPPDVAGAVLITSFYSVPTYVAVVAVGQALGYFERYRTRERLLARAELRALEAQLNPHFLFNTLNAISALGYRDAARADEALTRLAAMLRTSLKGRPELIALKDEIAFIGDYLDLYSLLMPNRTKFAIEVEPDAWNAAIPAMLLQPLVENALLHGLAKLEGGGRLQICAKRAGASLSLILHNDAPQAVAPSNGAGIGLANTRERLRVLFGDAATLVISRNTGDATVEIALPFSEAQA